MAPLKVEVKNGKLTIEIGIDTLEFASRSENGGPLENCKVDRNQLVEWAKDVAIEIQREDEVGDSPLARFLDESMQTAADNGSCALIFDKYIK